MQDTATRIVENDFVLDTDPIVWGERYTRGQESWGGGRGDGCCLCGKRTGSGVNTAIVLVSHRGTALPVSELPADGEALGNGEVYDEGGHTLGCFPIGRECAKTIDPKFVIFPQS